MKTKKKESDAPRVQCEKCIFFQEPKYDVKKYKFTPAKCDKGLKLVFVAASSFVEDLGLRGYVRECSKFTKKTE